ncbi:MAG: YgjV family protein [Lachnospiraceae bacterium]|nr:YgjV family protein [Lachnospiraceae bacterium]
MNTSLLIELIGYLGSTLVVISMLMSSVIKLRIINLIGSAVFAAYALMIHSYPTACMNLFLVGINGYNLIKLLKKDQHYTLLEGKTEDAFIEYLWNSYKTDILTYFPDVQKDNADKVYFVCCDTVPAGFLLGKESGNGVLDVLVDYSTPTYRDCSVGKYLYSKLWERGIRTLRCSKAQSKQHIEYLKKMGFVKDGEWYRKELKKEKNRKMK